MERSDRPDRLEEMLIELRRRSLRIVRDEPVPEPEATLVSDADIARVEELIAQHGWEHLRVPKRK